MEVWPKGDIIKHPQYYMIEGVSQVKYVSAGHDFEFDSSADYIAELKNIIQFTKFRVDKYKSCYTLVRNFCITTLLENVVSGDDEKYKKIMDEWGDVIKKIEKIRTEVYEAGESYRNSTGVQKGM